MRILFLLCILMLVLRLAAQTQDSVRTLGAVEISADRYQGGRGQDIVRVDSVAMALYQGGTLADLLGSQGLVLMKTYGPGRLATATMQGAGAVHTPVLWNGINLQSPLNGQVDFALLPVLAADRVEVQQGGAGATTGNGAMGGVIHLHTRPAADSGISLRLRSEGGSFGSLSQHLRADARRSAWTTSLRAFYRRADNDFRYPVPLGAGRDTLLRQAHAALWQGGLLHETRYTPGPKTNWLAWVWLQHSDREIPRAAYQTDRQARAGLSWTRLGSRSTLVLRSSLLDESLAYRDTLTGLQSRQRSLAWVSEADVRRVLARRQRLHLGLAYTWAQAMGADYAGGAARQSQAAAFAMYQHAGEHAHLTLGLRQAWIDARPTPLAPEVALEWRPVLSLTLRSHLSRTYRQPTFNDRYWQPGGNADLRPERGWSWRGGGEHRVGDAQRYGKAALHAFANYLDDYIIWQPGGSYWTPANLRTVWARGGELRLDAGQRLGHTLLQAGAGYRYTRSTLLRSQIPGDQAVGMQLIYVPRHEAHLMLSWQTTQGQLRYTHRVVGRRYTAADNSAALPAFQLGDLAWHGAFKKKGLIAKYFVRIDNIYNTYYQVVPSYPMPGRSVSLGIEVGGRAFGRSMNKQGR
ncbi:MAG: TonB-dependent receptor [Bacteroidia bacterium]